MAQKGSLCVRHIPELAVDKCFVLWFPMTGGRLSRPDVRHQLAETIVHGVRRTRGRFGCANGDPPSTKVLLISQRPASQPLLRHIRPGLRVLLRMKYHCSTFQARKQHTGGCPSVPLLCQDLTALAGQAAAS